MKLYALALSKQILQNMAVRLKFHHNKTKYNVYINKLIRLCLHVHKNPQVRDDPKSLKNLPTRLQFVNFY